MSTTGSCWSVDREPGLVALTFARPPRNMMSFAAMAELEQHLLAVRDEPEMRVVVLLSATPGYFVGHGELADLIALGRGEPASGPARVWGTTFALIEDMPQPVIAAIDGQAWGGGCELASTCAVRLASEDADFAQPEVDLGIIPGAGGTARLAQLVGLGRAMELILSGRVIDAREAHAIGLVQRVLPAEGFREAALDWARALVRKPSGTLRAAKESVQFAAGNDRRDALGNEARLFMELQSSVATEQIQRAALDLYAATAASERIVLHEQARGSSR